MRGIMGMPELNMRDHLFYDLEEIMLRTLPDFPCRYCRQLCE